jgi:hypothetical protein
LQRIVESPPVSGEAGGVCTRTLNQLLVGRLQYWIEIAWGSEAPMLSEDERVPSSRVEVCVIVMRVSTCTIIGNRICTSSFLKIA